MAKPIDYASLYALTDTVTPLPVDCGSLCGGICCQGGDGDGMRLFPGEAEVLSAVADFTVRPTSDGGALLTCTGRCDRRQRPLACRLFPLFPRLYPDGRVRAVFDPRAYRLCPLVQGSYRPRSTFLRAVRRTGRRLAATEEGRRYLAEQAADMDAVAALIPRFAFLPRRGRNHK